MPMDEPPPKIHVRWFQVGVPELLSLAPITLGTSVTWKPFTRSESDACEAAWQEYRQQQRKRELQSPPNLPTDRIEENSAAEPAMDESVSATEIEEQPVEEVDNGGKEEYDLGIPIEREQLFEVDVKKMKLQPVYWQTSGPQINVMRAVWMYDENRPVEKELADKIEEAYLSVKPWLPFYQDELDAARQIGPEAQEKLKYPLEGTNFYAIFDDASSVQIISTTYTPQRFTSAFSRSKNASSSGVTAIYRGYDEAARRTGTNAKPAASAPSGDGINAPGAAIKSEATPPTPKNLVSSSSDWGGDTKEEVTDLILVVHGIGQGLTAQYEAYNFVYATNLFRNVARKQATTPALASIMRSKRVQFLPVQWRASMKFDLDGQAKSEGHENHFTLSEITPKGTIPYIRELTNNVLTDIPLFMSHHRERMIEAVCHQANRAYRLWCARNPRFEKHGRVHILAHSLGSALVTHILSNQPTIVPPLSELSKEDIKAVTEQFLFNTSTLFMVGSPVSVFLRIHESPLIARRGRERTKHSPRDEAMDRVGLFGCLAVDSIYNIFNPADPIAYLMNPCVDSTRAKDLPPTQIPDVTTPALAPLTTFSSKVGRLFEGITPFSSGSKRIPKALRNQRRASVILASPQRPDMMSMNSDFDSDAEALGGIELPDSGKGGPVLEGSRAERRFLALNPHGTLDYYLPSGGNISEYVDMLTAHSSYWADASLAAFMQAEIFAKKTDAIRTGLGTDAGFAGTPV